MWPSYSVQLPPGSRDSIERFLHIELASLDQLSETVRHSEATADVEDLAESCAVSTGVSTDEIEAVLTVAINLSRLRRTLRSTAAEAAAALTEALPRAFGERWFEERASLWTERLRILEELIFEDGPVDVMAKVRDLLYDYQTVLADTSVVTDVRHVYNDSADQIVGGLVLHNIGLRFLEAGEIREMHFTLSSPAVRVLLRQLERALLKAATATSFITGAGVPELTPKRDREP